ncbi:hypothetical protein EVAR_94495_1 [Eumeta japonica]|uniref:Uncharacterized protein n=1 Tax=Eumeta variegata TaxID=151549 RepID=A0A4C1UVZ0_EUMVA|nr:hypothetical protein EVAR_94495_1 [Eumeta japonica]
MCENVTHKEGETALRAQTCYTVIPREGCFILVEISRFGETSLHEKFSNRSDEPKSHKICSCRYAAVNVTQVTDAYCVSLAPEAGRGRSGEPSNGLQETCWACD